MRQEPANPAVAPDQALARLAANQHGVVSASQLYALGIRPGAVSRRVRAGRFHRVHRGVYALGHNRLSNEGRWMAAVLACGPGAVLSHRAAAAHWSMLPVPGGLIDVTVLGAAGREKRAGIRLHRSVSLTQQETTRRAGIPVTNPARTLADLRRAVSVEELGRARCQAEIHGYRLGDQTAIEPDLTRSELEQRFLSLCRRYRLPGPEVNVAIGEYVVDFLWRPWTLIVETDGYRYHAGRAAFEYDYRRQAHLIAAGFEVMRFTWRQIVEEPSEVIAAIRARLTPSVTQPGSVGR